uniref:Ovo-like zinc finger 1b n=1 Tax=Cyprinus carpio TaxID=7962 RepID=A0A8C1J679_CYPCA
MPRAFLVKKVNIAAEKRSWSEIPDSARGDVYIPGQCLDRVRVPLGAWGSHVYAQLPSSAAQGQPDHKPECHMRTQRPPYSHSKIKVTDTPPAASVLSCQVCQKTFTSARMLKRHVKRHSETKKYSCEHCGKGFNDAFDLKRHVRTHTGVRPYKCTLCVKAFTQRCSLESHLRKIHAVTQQYAYKERRDKLYVCEECGLTAQTRKVEVNRVLNCQKRCESADENRHTSEQQDRSGCLCVSSSLSYLVEEQKLMSR